MDKLAQALRHLEQGEWEKAHVIVQEEHSTLASWLHGLVHVQEGDLSNARYWYRQAGRAFPEKLSVIDELAAAKDALHNSRVG
jgi:hypothetical protein